MQALSYLLIGAVGTWLAIRYARVRSLIDAPGERRSHVVPTPRGGGIAIVLAVSVAAVLALLQGSATPGAGVLTAFLVGFLAIAGIGWMDDHRALSAGLRMLVHVVAAGAFAGALWHATGSPLYAVLAFVSAVALTNVWNFMDGINGLAASQASLAAVLLAGFTGGAWTSIAVALLAASLAFLPFNFPKARIFMGDVGSGAIGFALAALFAVATTSGPPVDASASMARAALLSLPFSAFLIDAGLTLARRVLRGERWWTPHVQHAYQAWARRSGHVPVTLAYAVWTLLACVVVLFSREWRPAFMLASTLAWYTTGVLAWGWIQRSCALDNGRRRQGDVDDDMA